MSLPRTLDLRYGRGHLTCAVAAHAEILEPREPARSFSRESFQAGVNQILPPVLPQGPIAIVVADKTRLCGYPTILPWLTEAILARGANRRQITFYIAYGTHTPQSDAESLSGLWVNLCGVSLYPPPEQRSGQLC